MKARPQDRTTNRPAKLTRNGADDSDPDWSPDGTTIAFASDRTGDEEIWPMRTDGTSATNLTRSPKSEDFRPDWQPFPYPDARRTR
jgi:Tol biopolymer transport system component